MPEEGKDMVEKAEQAKKGGEIAQGLFKKWGDPTLDPAIHGPDIKPEEGRRLFRQDQAERESRKAREPRRRPVNVRRAAKAARDAEVTRIREEHKATSAAIGEPGPQPSRVPYSEERMIIPQDFGRGIAEKGRAKIAQFLAQDAAKAKPR